MDLSNLSEQEQVQLIRTWLKKYVPSILIGIAFAFALSFGWHRWTAHKNGHIQQASVLYEQMLSSKMSHGNQSETLANTLTSKYSDTPYGIFAGLFQATNAINQNNFSLAEQKLQWVIDHAHNPAYKQVAKLRLARVLFAENKFLQALDVLNHVSDDSFVAEIELIKGDIFVAMKNYGAAKIAYKNVLATLPKYSSMQSLVEMKLANLTS